MATKRKSKSDYIRIKSLSYWLRHAIAEIEHLSPEAREALGKVIGDSDLIQIKDLAQLEKALRKLSFNP